MKAQMRLSIVSKFLEPDTITKIVDINPDNTVIRGDKRSPPKPAPETYGWHVRCINDSVDDVNDIIIMFLERVKNVEKSIENLRKKDKEIKVSVDLIFYSAIPDIAMVMDRKFISFLGKLESSLEMEFLNSDGSSVCRQVPA